jgi:hypothetical protein
MKVALITNLCSHYRYKLFKILIENHQFSVYFFENLEKSKEDIEHLTVYKNFAGFSYMPVRKILQKLKPNLLSGIQFGIIPKLCSINCFHGFS